MGVASLYGNVASEALRSKMTSWSPWVSTFLRPESRLTGPRSLLILSIRSKENFTSSEVRASPLLNFSPARSLHR